MKQIIRTYPDNEIPYANLYDILLNFRIEILKNGLMESQLNKLELYLRELCAPHDVENKGLVHVDDLIRELKKSDKIILSKTQVILKEDYDLRV